MSNAGISSSDRANQYAIQQTYSRLLRLTSELLNVAAAIVTTVDGGPLRGTPWPILRAQPAYSAAEQVIATLLPYPSPPYARRGRELSFDDIRAQKLGSSNDQRDGGVEEVLLVTRPLPAGILKHLQIRLQRTAALGKRDAGKARVLVSINGRQAKLGQLVPKKKKLLIQLRVIQAP